MKATDLGVLGFIGFPADGYGRSFDKVFQIGAQPRTSLAHLVVRPGAADHFIQLGRHKNNPASRVLSVQREKAEKPLFLYP
jgi:hypothetical protein